MPTILVAADAEYVRDAVQAALVRPDYRVVQATRGQDVVPYVCDSAPDLVVLDMQVGNMGGIATAREMRLESSSGRCADVPVLLLLDRQADKFLARRADVDALIVKPFDAGTLRRVVKQLLERAGSEEPGSGEPGPDDVAAGGPDDLLPANEPV